LTALADTDHQVEGLEAGADAYMAKPFDLREFAAQVRALIRAARRERDRNPTTDLPGSRAIDSHLEQLLKSGQEASVLHFDLLAFDGFTDAAGFGRAEEVVRATGRLILDEARTVTGGSAFVGHFGGSDFIAVVAPAQAEALAAGAVAAFEARRGELASGGDDTPALAMVVAVAPIEGVSAIDELARRLGKAMRAAKAAGRSGHVAWTAG
jgi:GGDEF domain-containing protein